MTNTVTEDGGAAGNSSSGRVAKTKPAVFALLVVVAALVQGCPRPPGEKFPSSPPIDRRPQVSSVSAQTSPRGQFGVPATIVLQGWGTCAKLQIDFGDGTPPLVLVGYNFLNPPTLAHLYQWGGTRTITVSGLDGCQGSPQTSVKIPAFRIGYLMPRPTPCDAVPNLPALPANATVHITSNTDPKISFGCLGGCHYDADGMTGLAPQGQGYPFPGLRLLSLVLRVGGNQIFQGGKDVTFTTGASGALETCANDYKMDDNQDAWGIALEVDYPGPP